MGKTPRKLSTDRLMALHNFLTPSFHWKKRKTKCIRTKWEVATNTKLKQSNELSEVNGGLTKYTESTKPSKDTGRELTLNSYTTSCSPIFSSSPIISSIAGARTS